MPSTFAPDHFKKSKCTLSLISIMHQVHYPIKYICWICTTVNIVIPIPV